MTRTITLAVLAPVLLLGGCLSFGGEAPDSLLTLTPTATAPAGAGAAAASASAGAFFFLPMSEEDSHVACVDGPMTCHLAVFLTLLT